MRHGCAPGAWKAASRIEKERLSFQIEESLFVIWMKSGEFRGRTEKAHKNYDP
jgi:hypothetical protein